jgi:hypothetical protein
MARTLARDSANRSKESHGHETGCGVETVAVAMTNIHQGKVDARLGAPGRNRSLSGRRQAFRDGNVSSEAHLNNRWQVRSDTHLESV